MGLFDKIKKGLQSAMAFAKMDDFLIEQIDLMLCERWQKTGQRTPTNIGGVSLEEEAEYLFQYSYQGDVIIVEVEHEFPMLEIEIQKGMEKYETKIMVSEYVDKDGTQFALKNETNLRGLIDEMASLVE